MTGGGNEPASPVDSFEYMTTWCENRCLNKTEHVREIITFYDCQKNAGFFADYFNHSVVTAGLDINCHSMNVDCRCDKGEWYLRYWAIFLSLFGLCCIMFKVVLYAIHKIQKQKRKWSERSITDAIKHGPRESGKSGSGFDNAAFTINDEDPQDRLHKQLWLDVGSDANLR